MVLSVLAARRVASRAQPSRIARLYSLPPSARTPMAEAPPAAGSVVPPVAPSKRVIPTTTVGAIPTSATLPQAATAAPAVPVTPPPSGFPANPPPPSGGQRKSGAFRRTLGYSLFTVLSLYTIATYVALQNDSFEEFYTSNVPLAQSLVEWAEDRELDKIGAAEVMAAYSKARNSATSLYGSVTGASADKASSASSIEAKASELKAKAAAAAHDVKASLEQNAKAAPAKDAAENNSKTATSPGEDARARVFAPVDDSALKVRETREAAEKKANEAKAVAERKAAEIKETTEKKAAEAKAAAEKKATELKEASARKVEEAKTKAAELQKKAAEAAAATKTELGSKAAQAQAKGSELKQEAGKEFNHLVAEGSKLVHAVEDKAVEIGHAVADKAAELKSKAGEIVESVEHKTVDLKEEALKGIEAMKQSGTLAAKSTSAAVSDVKDKTIDAADAADNKVEDLVNRAEAALREGVQDVKHIHNEEATTAAKAAWTEPLPLGFEAPPGYTVDQSARPPVPVGILNARIIPASVAPVATTKDGKPLPGHPLPLIAPTVHAFSASEPIITQLASTIDSLAAYLAQTPSALPSAKQLISTAQLDLEALGKRLNTVKGEEKTKLENLLNEKKTEYERLMKEREVVLEDELEKREEGWKDVVEEERRRLVSVFKQKLDHELAAQSEIIDERLKEEVMSQGIELQKRWIRDIKAQVDSERGGRLSKLDELESGLKELEKVTLDNSAVLDENVRVHTLWSALRAAQSAIDAGARESIAAQLSALSSLAPSSSSLPSSSSSSVVSSSDSTIPAVLSPLTASKAASEGVESLPDLTYWFTQRVAPRIRSVALVPTSADAGVLAHVASAVLSPLLFRKTGADVEGDDVASVLARAEARLARADLDGAAREVNQLKGWPAVLAADWLDQARKRLEVQQALDVVSTEATLSSLLVV